jgi:cytochrome c-type biogenesis protein CcmH
MNIARVMCAAVLLLCALPLHAENFDVYPFASAEEEARFDRLTHELRCPKCQNQSIADSNAPIALDLRQRTYELVREGNSDEEIVNYLKERYGDFITYRPPFNAVTVMLWAGPFLLLMLAVVVLLLLRRRRPPAGSPAVSGESVSAILARHDTPGGDKP